jgi:hypothetical protein
MENKSKLLWPINKLHEWDKNPRNIEKKDFERLKQQIIRFGQYKPLLITPDGVVLGGNMRLKAYKQLKITDIWVSIVNPKNENEKLEYSLSDNDRAGYYDADLLANLMPNYQIDWDKYAIDLNVPSNITEILRNIGTGNVNIDEMWKEMPEYGNALKNQALRTIFVHFKTNEDVIKFAELINQKITNETKYIWFPYKEKEKIKNLAVITENES